MTSLDDSSQFDTATIHPNRIDNGCGLSEQGPCLITVVRSCGKAISLVNGLISAEAPRWLAQQEQLRAMSHLCHRAKVACNYTDANPFWSPLDAAQGEALELRVQ